LLKPLLKIATRGASLVRKATRTRTGNGSGADHQRMAALTALLNDRSQPNLNALSILVRNIDLLALNVKTMGYDLAKTMAAELPVYNDTVARHVGLASKASTQADLESEWVAHWCGQLKIPVLYHRKLWELGYILQAVYDSGGLRAGARGLGFGCGSEPMASYFASLGVSVTITDLPADDDRAKGWAGTHQHAAEIEAAYHPALVSREAFDARVTYRPVDMNAIPADLRDYDFCWSMCAFEHLGSIAQGLAFVENSLETLRPGGMAVHTTEFNINPVGPTIDNWPTVLFQRRHFEALADRLRARGHHVAPFDFETGDKPLDRFIDLPPWHDGTLEVISKGLGQPHHLKVGVDGFISTCFGLIVTKAG
jgi:2-polyprenyl-3-methyl-5-hydroxy-6-metoxy-1,4-benzoquinol methylase